MGSGTTITQTQRQSITQMTMKGQSFNLGAIQVPRRPIPCPLRVNHPSPFRHELPDANQSVSWIAPDIEEPLDDQFRPLPQTNGPRSLSDEFTLLFIVQQNTTAQRVSERVGDLVIAGYSVREARLISDTPAERARREMYEVCRLEITRRVGQITGDMNMESKLVLIYYAEAKLTRKLCKLQPEMSPMIDLSAARDMLQSTSSRVPDSTQRARYSGSRFDASQVNRYSSYLSDEELGLANKRQENGDPDAVESAIEIGRKRYMIDNEQSRWICGNMLEHDMIKIIDLCLPLDATASRKANAVRVDALQRDMACVSALSSNPVSRRGAMYLAASVDTAQSSLEAKIRHLDSLSNVDLATHLGHVQRGRDLCAGGAQPTRDIDLYIKNIAALPQSRM
jgi:hypothetical protein